MSKILRYLSLKMNKIYRNIEIYNIYYKLYFVSEDFPNFSNFPDLGIFISSYGRRRSSASLYY